MNTKYYENFLKEKIIDMIQKTKDLRTLNFIYHYLLGKKK